MTILTEKTNLNPGDPLTAEMVNRISETAVAAYQKAEDVTTNIESLINKVIGQALKAEV